MKKTLAIIAIAVHVVAQAAHASVSIDFKAADIRDHTGAIVPTSAIALMVADTSGGLMATLSNGLSTNSSLALNSFLTNTNGQNVGLILGKWDIDAGSGTPGQLSNGPRNSYQQLS